MGRFIALWTKPTDIEAFERYYREEHMPLVEAWPGLRSSHVTRITGAPLGGDPAYYLLFVAEVEDMDVLLSSEPLARVVEDAQEIMERFGNQVVPLTGEGL